ncbi:MAG: hypothetical protein IJR97_00680 [Clostridia bacterium]|nr:hypothetical protein [Clostridia bacterium]
MLKRRSFFAVFMLCAFALAAGEPCAAASGNAWQQACRQLITSGDYQSFLSPNVPEAYGERSEWLIIFNDRDTAWDAFALHDMDGDGTPELIVRTEYGMEQADVFTFSSGRPVLMGTMGGDNFFQDIIYYDNFGYRGLFTVMGGPAMTVERIRSCSKNACWP